MKYRALYAVLCLLSLSLAALPNDAFSVIEIIRLRADASLIALFNSLGVLPALFLVERWAQARPFTLRERWAHGGAFAFGAFALLWGLDEEQRPDFSVLWVRWLHRSLVLALMALGLYALAFGSGSSWFAAWRSEWFVRVMSIDFMVLLGLWLKRWWIFLSTPPAKV
jgi:hypothetical protein